MLAVAMLCTLPPALVACDERPEASISASAGASASGLGSGLGSEAVASRSAERGATDAATATESPARPPVVQDPASSRREAAEANPVRVGPVLLSAQQVDFGIVGPNTMLETEIQITNVTDAPLKIIGSVPTCQCTTVDMTGVVIEPGESVPMPMGLKTAGSTGVREAGITLVFEGHPTPVAVSLKTEVAYSVRATPPFIDVQQSPRDRSGNVGAARPLTGTIRLQSVDDKPFRVLAVHGEPPRFSGFDSAQDAPRTEYTIIYDLAAAHAAGRMPHYVIVETDRDDCPAIDLRVRHETTQIRPSFPIAEFRSAVGLLKPGETGQFDIEIRNFGQRRIVDVSTKDPTIATTRLVDQSSDGTNVLVTVSVTPAAGVRGLLYFTTTLRASDGATTDLIVFGRVAD
jgi:hypothetical protein